MMGSALWGAEWSTGPSVPLALAVTAWLYLRGFARIRWQSPQHFPRWRRSAFILGLLLLFFSLASPLDAAADVLLLAHMVQHWLLMMVIPPLIWLGAPVVPLLRGLPGDVLARGAGPLLSSPSLRRLLEGLTHPAAALGIWIGVTVAWHWPRAYELALGSRAAHDFEHISFLAASLLLWFRILEPWPLRKVSAFSARLLVVVAAGLFNSIFSATFAFSSAPFYEAYAALPNPWGISVMEDQNTAGAFMWIGGSVCMIAAVVGLTLSGLSPSRLGGGRPAPRGRPKSSPGRSLGQARWLRSLGLRRSLQWILFAAALLVMLDGLLGPQIPSAENLAGVLPWTYWRALSLFALLALGNAFCAVCPLTLSRRLAAHWLGRPFRWPARLQNKWLSAALFLLYLWSYEVLGLWNRPMATAIWIGGFFVLCFLVEGLFQRGTFCRYVCPVGQFQFVHAGLSPSEVQALSKDVCSRCTSHDCLQGNSTQSGCPTDLYLPAKTGNLDCTFCLDCVRACPHENAGLVPVLPARSLGQGRMRGQPMGLDLAALSALFVWGGFVNAMAMSAPVVDAERTLAAWLGLEQASWTLSASLLGGVVLLPLFALPPCAALGGWLSRSGLPVLELVRRFVPALVPIGFAMWLAHFGFHFLTGISTAIPAGQRVLRDLSADFPERSAMAAPNLVGWLTDAQIFVLGVGLVISIAVLWRIGREIVPQPARAMRLAFPWSLLALALWGLGAFIYLSPMEMRGTMP